MGGAIWPRTWFTSSSCMLARSSIAAADSDLRAESSLGAEPRVRDAVCLFLKQEGVVQSNRAAHAGLPTWSQGSAPGRVFSGRSLR